MKASGGPELKTWRLPGDAVTVESFAKKIIWAISRSPGENYGTKA